MSAMPVTDVERMMPDVRLVPQPTKRSAVADLGWILSNFLPQFARTVKPSCLRASATFRPSTAFQGVAPHHAQLRLGLRRARLAIRRMDNGLPQQF